MTDVDGFRIFKGGELGDAGAEAGPAFCDDDAVLRVAGLIANGAGIADADLSLIDEVADHCDVLGALVVNTADAVVEDEQGECAAVFALHLSDVEQHAVDKAARLDEELAPGALEFVLGGSFSERKPENGPAEESDGDHSKQDFKSVFIEEVHSRAGLHLHGPKARIPQQGCPVCESMRLLTKGLPIVKGREKCKVREL